MMKLKNKNIILAVTGGIAAYKSADLIRRLREQGATVQVVMTESAKQFISPLTLQALSGRKIRDALFSLEAENAMSHIELARWADLLLVAPASANTIAAISQGLANDLLTTLCLATAAPIMIAPAMNQQMWNNSITATNIYRLKQHEITVLGPASGLQACGDIGLGRMLEPEEIVTAMTNQFAKKILTDKKVLITAGPTREKLDPVRCLTNISSGKMGYALATAAANLGAQVILISGPCALESPANVECIRVETAEEMLQAVISKLVSVDIFIAAAAVTDYRPATISKQKLKKSTESLQLKLQPTPDILATVSSCKQRPKLVIGFAAETNDLLANAKHKLEKKSLDAIVVNQVGKNMGFEQAENQASLIFAHGAKLDFPLMSKIDLSYNLLRSI